MQSRYDRCPNCMQGLSNGEDVCPHCGFEISQYNERKNCLRPFTVLQNKYMIGRVIGVGGFGITYIGWDLNLQTYIAIKEYYPDSIASRDTSVSAADTQVIPNDSKKDIYDKGLKRYVEEAQSLSRFYQLQGIVSVKDFFYENGTGYIVMEYINGINLKEFLNNSGGKLDESTVLALMKPVLESLYQVHNAGVVHRDISPDNIMVDRENRIKLIDFGSARGSSNESDKTFTVILKHGYAPSEQYYAKGNQGPWTDIYSLCATMYKMLTGQLPPNSIERMENDEYVAPSAWGVPVSPRTEAVLNKGLAVKVSDRYQNLGQMLNDLFGTTPINSIVAPTPMPSAPSYVSPTSMSQQSMHLSMQPVMAANVPAEAKSRNKTGLIIGGIIAAVAIIAIVLVIVLGGKDKDDKKDKDGTTTEAPDNPGGTEEPDIPDGPGGAEPDEPVEPDTPSASYEWPTEISDNWRDYHVSIDGTIYALPIPYTEWEAQGWKTKDLTTHIAGNGSDYAYFEKDGIEVYALFYNYKLNEAPIEECYIIGLNIDSENVPDDAEIILAGGIQMYVSTLEDIKLTFGAPENIYESEEYGYTALDYAGDEWEDGMDLEVDTATGTLSCINIANTAMPEGIDISPSDIGTDAPEINSQYVAPTGPSTNNLDNIITIDSVNYKLPVPVSVLMEDGWVLDTATEQYIEGFSYDSTYMEKEGNKISVEIENFTPNAILPMHGYITSIEVEEGYCAYDVIFPGGMMLGMTGADMDAAYTSLGDDYTVDDWGYTICYSVWVSDEQGYISIYAYEDTESGVIDSYSYSYSVYSDYFE